MTRGDLCAAVIASFKKNGVMPSVGYLPCSEFSDFYRHEIYEAALTYLPSNAPAPVTPEFADTFMLMGVPFYRGHSVVPGPRFA